MTLLFPGVPIVVGVVALYLVGRGCGAPNEAVRKMKAGLGHDRFLLGAGVVEQVYFSLIPGVVVRNFNTKGTKGSTKDRLLV
jgi:hypothetical protein